MPLHPQTFPKVASLLAESSDRFADSGLFPVLFWPHAVQMLSVILILMLKKRNNAKLRHP